MSFINLKKIATEAMSDPEFSREMRYFTGKVKLAIAEEETILEFDDGKLVAADVKYVDDSECKIFVKGDKNHWENMLAPYPVPFFQCFQTANVKHGLVLSCSNETFAYLPALNRLLQITRNEHNKG